MTSTSRVVVRSFSVSLDGYAAGPDQDLEHPLGVGGERLMEWFFRARAWREMHGEEGGETGVDHRMALEGLSGMGAWILGRNMFGPVRGPWPNEDWKGWWGEEPPYHVPTFVLTHHARKPIPMKGGTEFRFVTTGIHDALKLAREAAAGRDVRVGGGVSTIRAFLEAGLIDEMSLAIRPILMGRGENLWTGLDLRAMGYDVAEQLQGERAFHVTIRRAATVQAG